MHFNRSPSWLLSLKTALGRDVTKLNDQLLFWSAVLVMAWFGIRGWMQVDMNFDTWMYHIPFAARLVGLVPSEAFMFIDGLEARYKGFPLLVELIQGLLWRITGRLEAINLVNWGALVGFILYVRWVFRWPIAVTTFGLLAVPMVLLHVNLGYIDLISNVFLLVGWISTTIVVLNVWSERRGLLSSGPVVLKQRWVHTAVALLGMAAAANSKFLLLQLVLVMFGVLMGTLGLSLWGPLKQQWVQRSVNPAAFYKQWLGGALALGAVTAVVFYPAIKNSVVFHNPLYPLMIAFSRWPIFYGPEGISIYSTPSLLFAPRPVRWLVSVLELYPPDSFKYKGPVWALDQYNYTGLGGYCGPYVALWVLLVLGWFGVKGRQTWPGKGWMISFGLFTLLVACMPQSHELRYYMGWMMWLVIMGLMSVYGCPCAISYGVQGLSLRPLRDWLTWGVVGVFLMVNTLLNWAPVRFSNESVASVSTLLRYPQFRAHVVLPLQSEIERRGAGYKPVVCLFALKERIWPRFFLFSPLFHDPHLPDYVVRFRPCQVGDRWVSLEEWNAWEKPGPHSKKGK